MGGERRLAKKKKPTARVRVAGRACGFLGLRGKRKLKMRKVGRLFEYKEQLKGLHIGREEARRETENDEQLFSCFFLGVLYVLNLWVIFFLW